MHLDRYKGQTPIKNLHIPRSNKNSKISNPDQDHFFLIFLHILIGKFDKFRRLFHIKLCEDFVINFHYFLLSNLISPGPSWNTSDTYQTDIKIRYQTDIKIRYQTDIKIRYQTVIKIRYQREIKFSGYCSPKP
jgi:hypothetical protein